MKSWDLHYIHIHVVQSKGEVEWQKDFFLKSNKHTLFYEWLIRCVLFYSPQWRSSCLGREASTPNAGEREANLDPIACHWWINGYWEESLKCPIIWDTARPHKLSHSHQKDSVLFISPLILTKKPIFIIIQKGNWC